MTFRRYQKHAYTMVMTLLALITTPGAHGQNMDKIIGSILHDGQIPEELKKKLAKQQTDVLANVSRIQKTLEGIRSTGVNPEARARATAVKENQLTAARKEFVTLQAARQIVEGTATTLSDDELKEIIPDVTESIALASNPMLPTCGKKLPYRGDSTQTGWQSILDSFLNNHGETVAAVGRIEVDTEVYSQGVASPPKFTKRTYIGTGFAVSGREVMTAGHVAALFWDASTQAFRPGITGVYFNTGAEHPYKCANANANAREVKLTSIIRMTYTPRTFPKDAPLDFATFSLDAAEAPLQHYVSLANAAEAKAGNFVIVVGFPGNDGRVDQMAWRTAMNVPIQNGMYPVVGIKRIAPGMVVQECQSASAMHVPHNATTLNNASGSPIFDATSGRVVGIQVAGYREAPIAGAYCNLGLKSNLPQLMSAVPQDLPELVSTD